MQLGEDTLEVQYTHFCLPTSGLDNFSFLGAEPPPPADPSSEAFRGRKPHALSASGYWSQHIPHDFVEACGGPERCAALYAEARLRGQDKQFEAAFKGEWPGARSSQRRKPGRRTTAAEAGAAPVIGEHTKAIVEQRQEPDKKPDTPPRQREMFS